MGHVVPFMNGKGGTGKSVLARTYAVEAAKSGASVLIADLYDIQRTFKVSGPITERPMAETGYRGGSGNASRGPMTWLGARMCW